MVPVVLTKTGTKLCAALSRSSLHKPDVHDMPSIKWTSANDDKGLMKRAELQAGQMGAKKGAEYRKDFEARQGQRAVYVALNKLPVQTGTCGED